MYSKQNEPIKQLQTYSIIHGIIVYYNSTHRGTKQRNFNKNNNINYNADNIQQ